MLYRNNGVEQTGPAPRRPAYCVERYQQLHLMLIQMILMNKLLNISYLLVNEAICQRLLGTNYAVFNGR